MPTNAKMSDLRSAFEYAGFVNVKTILGTGNLAFDTTLLSEPAIETAAEEAMVQTLGRSFYTIARPSSYLVNLVAADTYAAYGIPAEAKRVVSFMRVAQEPKVPLPVAEHQASVFLAIGREAFTAYIPTDQGPVFMGLIERAFGKSVTTRTLDTVAKCATA